MADTRTESPSYTARNRRPNLREDRTGLVTRFVADIKATPAPPPQAPPRPFGELAEASSDDIVAVARRAWPHHTPATVSKRSRGLRLLLGHLAQFPGPTWQHRWMASGLDEKGRPVCDLYPDPDDPHNRYNLTVGMRALCCLRIIQPSLLAFRSNTFTRYSEMFQAAQQDPQLDTFFAEVNARGHIPRPHRVRAVFDVCCALTTQGIALADLTPSALLHYSYECRRHGVTPGANNDHTRFSALLAWQILHEIGHFPPSTPPSLRAFIYGGQKTVEELVDRYQIRHPGVRDLLIEYLRRRRADCDYVTIESLSRHLAGYFWATIEQINPAQDTLALDQATYAQWREALNYRKDGKPRRDPHSILLNVRGFYVDLHSWAIDDPATWGPWVATCPIPRSDLRGMGTRRRRLNERIADRTRARQPLLPTLVAHVESRYEQAKALMDAGAKVAPNQVLDHAQRRYRRMSTDNDRKRDDDPRPQVRLCDLETGEVVNATMAEGQAFWVWAAVEVLRLTGIRAEELVELTHLSIRQYQRPNGEVIALLVVAPSKTDRERVIPISAELFHVIAAIIRRHTTGGRRIHLLHRYDDHERTWSEPLPFLFQRQLGSVRNVVAKGTVLNWIKAACDELAETNKAFEDLRFTPHDFRRLFATDLVNSGLPIHIGARLLGHLSIETTRGYVDPQELHQMGENLQVAC